MKTVKEKHVGSGHACNNSHPYKTPIFADWKKLVGSFLIDSAVKSYDVFSIVYISLENAQLTMQFLDIFFTTFDNTLYESGN